ncbi:Cloroperoxidase, partial [Saccharata proteae CBS 121410]
GFNAAEQFIDVSGDHVYLAPSDLDARGPCPGLNVLANHGFISRDGITNYDEVIAASMQVFGFGEDVATILAATGIAMSGSEDLWTLSIGGPTEKTAWNSTGNLKYPTRGLSGTHISFEGDASPTRQDLYKNTSVEDNIHLQLPVFIDLYNLESSKPSGHEDYNLAVLGKHKMSRIADSIANNMHFFAGPLNAPFGENAAHVFIASQFANHSAECPAGRLDRESLKAFFGVTGGDDPSTFVYTKGTERIPEQGWYRRPLADPYNLTKVNADFVTMYKANSGLLYHFIGGNTWNNYNEFAPIDIGTLTGGNYSAETMYEGNNMLCLGATGGGFLQPLFLDQLYHNTTPATELLAVGGPFVKLLNCPEWDTVDMNLFEPYLG